MSCLHEALDAPSRDGQPFARALIDARVYTCKRLTTNVVVCKAYPKLRQYPEEPDAARMQKDGAVAGAYHARYKVHRTNSRADTSRSRVPHLMPYHGWGMGSLFVLILSGILLRKCSLEIGIWWP